MEVLSAVLLVFTLENVFEHAFAALIPAELEIVGWVAVYVVSIVVISALNYTTADEEARDDLEEDLDDL
jgi:hypothetical protein